LQSQVSGNVSGKSGETKNISWNEVNVVSLIDAGPSNLQKAALSK